jgi:hypothetical protein
MDVLRLAAILGARSPQHYFLLTYSRTIRDLPPLVLCMLFQTI